MKKQIPIVIGLGIALTLSACDSDPLGPLETIYVVESYQVAGKPLQPVYLSKVVRFEELDQDIVAVDEALVFVELLDDTGSVVDRYAYKNGSDPGMYGPVDAAVVRPLRQYRLVVRPEGSSDILTAATTVPDTFRVLRIDPRRVVHEGPDRVQIWFTAGTGLETKHFLMFNESRNPIRSELTPYGESLNNVLYGVKDMAVHELPIFNENALHVESDGSYRFSVPWVAFPFYGENIVHLSVLDRNMLRHVQSVEAQRWSYLRFPGEIPGIVDFVEGGIGIFGSFAEIQAEVFVERPDHQP